jgi:hypothetical protein
VVNSSKLILRALSIIAFEVSVGFELVEEDCSRGWYYLYHR